MTTEESLVTTRHGSVLVLRINRPDRRNSLDLPVLAGIGSGITGADADPSIRAVILTGTGDKAFSAGMDLRAFSQGDMDFAAHAEGLSAFNTWVRQGVETPVICAANGPAVAGGFELLLACDLVVAADHATFGVPEVKRGLFAAGGGVFLSRRMPLAVALELGLTGDTISAEQALGYGLVNRVVPGAEVMDTATALADAIAANGPLAVQVTKRLMRAAATQPPEAVWALQDELQPGVFQSNDAKEGATAFVEKRPPVWTGS